MTPGMNMSTVLGQCPRKNDCDHIFKIYMALSVAGSFISACGGTPGYIVLLRSETLKLLWLGIMMPCGVLLILGICNDFMAIHASIKMGTLCELRQ